MSFISRRLFLQQTSAVTLAAAVVSGAKPRVRNIASAAEGSARLEVGAARRDMSPQVGQPMWGYLNPEQISEGVRDPLFAGLAPVARCLQWHAAEVVAPPAGAVTLAASPACAVQAFRVGDKAYGIQYHVEVTPDTVPEWGVLPAYRQALEKTLGAGALAGLEAEAARHLPELNRAARRLYDNFMALVRAPAG